MSTSNPAGVSLVIPCLNEARCIGPTLKLALNVFEENQLHGEILVVDNGSTDQTASIALKMGARVVVAAQRGYGSALRAGFEAARYEHVVTVDADLSYPLEELPKLIECMSAGTDIVLGNRLKGTIEAGAMPWMNRHLGTPVLSWLIRRLHKVPTFDCNSGFRGMRKTSLMRMPLQSRGMELASEILIHTGRLGLSYREVPISFRRDQRGARSHLRRWRDGVRHLSAIVGGLAIPAVHPNRDKSALFEDNVPT